MATIGKIRQHSGIVIGIIGFAILAFVISDAFQSNSRLFGGSDRDKVGEIFGDKISYKAFRNDYDIAIDNYKKQSGMPNISSALRRQILDQSWEQHIQKKILEKEYEEMGISVSSEELFYYTQGPNPSTTIKRYFSNEQGEFDRDNLRRFLKQMDQDEQAKQAWLELEQILIDERKVQKYVKIIENSAYTTILEAKDNFFNKNKFASIEYVAVGLETISDSSVSVTKKDLEKYYQEHKDLYKTDEPSRKIEYVSFTIRASQADTQLALKNLNKIKNDFEKTKQDSSFAVVNSDASIDLSYHPRGFFSDQNDEKFFNAQKGTFIGPYFEDGSFKLTKIVDFKEDTLEYYKASIILIKPQGNTFQDSAKAMEKGRKLLAEIKAGADFQEQVRLNSTHPSISNGGNLGWFHENPQTKELVRSVKNLKKGNYAIFKNKEGINIVKVTADKTNQMVKVITIVKDVFPSSKTIDVTYADVTKFRAGIKSAEDFNKKVIKESRNKKIVQDIAPNKPVIPGLTEVSDVIRWMFNSKTEVGDVSEIFHLIEDNQYIVCILVDAVEEGYTPLKYIEPQIKAEVIKRKKQDIIAEKMKSDNLTELANSLNTKVQTMSNISFNAPPFFPQYGAEMAVAGASFGLELNQVSDVIKGTNADFKIRVTEFSKVEVPKDFEETKNTMNQTAKQQIQYQILNILKKNAEVKDFRYKFF